ncbi:uncharacterized protein LOC127092701 isoform X1 [Lathyrus oleraceus]|uniref:uncharacterized protein LOC127092701 isoform X1 n=1 Tax=Pisum sativum TaxID=3888 RepID=UPI0021D07E4A|nr:uncharacterized protein LOC127092701 isoform X1 [Pisum sativum]
MVCYYVLQNGLVDYKLVASLTCRCILVCLLQHGSNGLHCVGLVWCATIVLYSCLAGSFWLVHDNASLFRSLVLLLAAYVSYGSSYVCHGSMEAYGMLVGQCK